MSDNKTNDNKPTYPLIPIKSLHDWKPDYEIISKALPAVVDARQLEIINKKL